MAKKKAKKAQPAGSAKGKGKGVSKAGATGAKFAGNVKRGSASDK